MQYLSLPTYNPYSVPYSVQQVTPYFIRSPYAIPKAYEDIIMPTVLIVVSVLLGLLEILITTCNLSLLFYLLKHLDFANFLLVFYFTVNFFIKVFTVIMGIATGCRPPIVIKSFNILVPVATNLIMFLVFLNWSCKNFSIHTNIGLIITSLLQIAVTTLIVIIGSETSLLYKCHLPPI